MGVHDCSLRASEVHDVSGLPSTLPSRPLARMSFAACGTTRGQVVIMFAVVASALIGMLGLSIDGGMYFYARRSAQAHQVVSTTADPRQATIIQGSVRRTSRSKPSTRGETERTIWTATPAERMAAA